jgi:hypothetical protein
MEADVGESIYSLGYGLEGLEFEFCEGQEMFLFSKPPRPALRSIEPSVHWAPARKMAWA